VYLKAIMQGCGLRQGEVFGFGKVDIRGDSVHVERQILMYKSQVYFGPPKGGKERDAPLPKALAKRLLTGREHFEPIDVNLPWLDPEEPDLAREDRRKVTVQLLVTPGEAARSTAPLGTPRRGSPRSPRRECRSERGCSLSEVIRGVQPDSSAR
jgi:integrase